MQCDSASGVVAANFGRQVQVLTDAGEALICELARDLGAKPVAGDHVRFERHAGTWCLTAIEPRRRVIHRLGFRGVGERILAAHVDLLLIICAVEPPLKEGLIDRYIVTAGHEGIDPVIVLNKIDLESAASVQRCQLYVELGYPVFMVSALTGQGVSDLATFVDRRTCVLVGPSGVGKSALLMALIPAAQTPTAAISDYSGKGVHTTTTARLWAGPQGLRLIDSPGIREFGLSRIEPLEVREHFVEIAALTPTCRYRDCLHLGDEGCAVRAAVEEGKITRIRYESYCRIVESLS
jgi:ribosome biogenesis GTPase